MPKSLASLADNPIWLPFVRIGAAAYLLRNKCVLRVDEPADRVIKSTVGMLGGWFASREKISAPGLRMNSVDLTWVNVDRPDVRRRFGYHHVLGFQAIVDINEVVAATGSTNGRLTLEVVVNGIASATKAVQLAPDVATDPRRSAEQRRRKHEWLQPHLACPVCGPANGDLEFTASAVRCRTCGETFRNSNSAYDFLPGDLKRKFQIDDWIDISSHEYDDIAKAIIEEARRNRGKVLDCGSGLRSSVDESVICLDVAAFPTTDVLGVNQRLPFRDGVFDAVLSLNVLEHVTDPFASASELVRVLKPGGKLYCCIPFLQPEHGYPHHYFNATRSGLRHLFPKNLELIRHFVPGSGEPVWSLQWFLSWYAAQLPFSEQQKFRALRFQDIIDAAPAMLLGEPWVSQLSSEGKWRLASTTAAIFRKPDGASFTGIAPAPQSQSIDPTLGLHPEPRS